MVFYYLNSLLRRAFYSDSDLKKYKDKRLRNLIDYVYTYVPFYHKKFRELGLKPNDFKSVKDLNMIPIIQKNEIRNNLKDMISTEFNTQDLKMLSTSGSTGRRGLRTTGSRIAHLPRKTRRFFTRAARMSSYSGMMPATTTWKYIVRRGSAYHGGGPSALRAPLGHQRVPVRPLIPMGSFTCCGKMRDTVTRRSIIRPESLAILPGGPVTGRHPPAHRFSI